jgi:hypothetical protein
MAQQLQQMQPMQQKLRPFKPCSPKVPTQTNINAIVGAIQMLEGQNSVLNQIVYDIIQGRYGESSPTSLVDSLSQSLSASMVEEARLFNLLVEHVNQDQPRLPTPYYHLLNYQWTLERKREQVGATSEYYLR